MISQSEVLKDLEGLDLEGSDLFPAVVKRSYERARITQRKFSLAISRSGALLPESSCVCINGSVSRLESVQDSDIDFVLIWNDALAGNNDKSRSIEAIEKINRSMIGVDLRPCNSFSCQQPISDILCTENLFSRYSILTLVDSSFVAGDPVAYTDTLDEIRRKLDEYAIGLSADMQVIRALMWYIQREGWIDQLHFGTSVNRFSRLIQLFTTILSVHQFGIDETRSTKPTWMRIGRLEPHLNNDVTECLKRLWIKALEFKETRAERPMLRDNNFIGVSKLVEIWQDILKISQVPVG
ncbi:MAG TPA: DUF294 nucleotidyltransferase-like domain-containing protein [Nitrososphaerales archaeon]|nr:DUF294 nucleotidyltransferase-like domain-containing protein [Nitrososphaerales archaeon]